MTHTKRHQQHKTHWHTFHSPVSDYTLLALGVMTCLAGFFWSWPLANLQRLWVILLGGFYVSWGSWHHLQTDRHLTIAIMAEYVTVALLVAITLFFAISYS